MAPVLAFADFEKEFQLETDASTEGLGAVLSQKQLDGKWHPVAFGSRELKGGEAKYHSSKLEFLALKALNLKGSDNKVADALSRIEARLDPDTVTELLNYMKAGAPAQAETDNIRIIEEEERAD